MSQKSLSDMFAPELERFESFLIPYFRQYNRFDQKGYLRLLESVEYSLSSPGKRFRPLLALMTAKALEAPLEKVLPVAASVEFIHTYSLIHDDLPCMDDDDLRRGQPTNHKKYGEAMALLAGDALLTEAFLVIVNSQELTSDQKAQCVQIIASRSGATGMVGGQSMDIEPAESGHSEQEINWVHQLKTGALIQASVMASAVASGGTKDQILGLEKYSELLGFAFQLADDIDDFDPENPEQTSYTNVFGVEETQVKLKQTSEKALEQLSRIGLHQSGLAELVHFNQNRVLPEV